MAASRLHIRFFLSSPGDVSDERSVAMQVFEQLQYDPLLRGKISVETVAWDKPGSNTPMLATKTPQEAINEGLPRPSECDIVVVILWSRLGTPLPHPDYQKPDGSRYLSGTEWEFWDAYYAAQQSGTERPALVVYRRTQKVLLDDEDPEFQQRLVQKQRVRDFFDAFVDPDGSQRLGYNPYETPENFRVQLEQHIRALVARLIEQQGDLPVPPKETGEPVANPFPGLHPFTTADQPFFFGRGHEIDTLIQKFREGAFVAVVGASGSGKSSLVGAGLIPRLKKGAIIGSQDWLLPEWNPQKAAWEGLRFTPAESSPNPFVSLAAQFGPMVDQPVQSLAGKLAESPDHFVTWCHRLLSGKKDWAEVFMFVDQFEELFSSGSQAYEQSFVELLYAAAQAERIRVVLTVRADFYPQYIKHASLADLFTTGSVSLSAPGKLTLKDMITRPADRAGLVFDEGLVDRILADVGDEPGSLALLGYALEQLYLVRDQNRLTHPAYAGFGGVQGAIVQRAEQVLQEIQSPTLNETFSRLFQALVQVDSRGIHTKVRALRSQFASVPEADQLIERLVKASLLVTGKDDANRPTVVVAHEALFSQWEYLEKWLETNQLFLLWKSQFQADVEQWQKTQQGKHSYLYAGYKLKDAEDKIVSNRYQLEDTERQFIQRSHLWRRIRQAAGFAVLAIPILISIIFLSQTIRMELLKRDASTRMVRFPAGQTKLGAMGQLVDLPAFSIEVYEVTYERYNLCVNAGACTPLYNPERPVNDQLPVTGINAYQAQAFCDWLDRRLPSGVEWERAVRGTDGRDWPWLDNQPPDRTRINALLVTDRDFQPLGVAPVTSFEAGRSPEGIYHLLGNAPEWTRTPKSCQTSPYTCTDVWDGKLRTELMIYDPGWQGAMPPNSVTELIAAAAPADPTLVTNFGFRCASN